MRKRIVAIIICGVLSLCFGMSFSSLQSFLYSQAEKIPFYQQIAQIDGERDIEYVYVEKEITLQSLQKRLGVEGDKNANIAMRNQTLTSTDVKQWCSQNDYIAMEEDDCYVIRNKYALKSLIVMGQYEDDYGAKEIASGYRDYSILYYDSVEATKNAYLSMLGDETMVILNSLVEAEEDVDLPVQESGYYDDYMSWGAEAMGLEEYNTYLESGNSNEEVVVAVLDTGINTSHWRFEDRILEDEEGNLVGYSYYDSTYTYSGHSFEDDKGHGTHVSGTIIELTPQNVKVLPIKVLASDGKGTTDKILGAFDYIEQCIADGYNIVCANMSLGAVIEDELSLTYWRTMYEDSIKGLKDEHDVLTVVAAGNDATDANWEVPASASSAITVSALKNTDGVYEFDESYSNYGQTIDISAPGSEVLSAYINPYKNSAGSYQATASGTSMAAPHVSAVVALYCIDKNYYVDGNSTYTGDEIEDRLFSGVVDLGSAGWDQYYGNGMITITTNFQSIEYSVENCVATYDGDYHNISVAVENAEAYTITYGLTNNNIDISDISGNDAFKNFTNGQMAVYFKITAEGYISTTGVGYLTINKSPLTISVQNQSFVYGNVNFDSSKYSITSGSILASDKSALALTTTARATSGVGEYDIVMTCSSENYFLSANIAKLTISPRDISIKMADLTSVYGEEIKLSHTFSITSGSLVGEDKLIITTQTTATSQSDAGEYEISFKSCDDGNYNISATSGALTITPRDISIALSSQTLGYGESYALDNEAFIVSEGTIVGQDKLGLTLYTKEEISGVGKYTIGLESYTNKNYNIKSAQEGQLEVTQRQLTLTIANQTFDYGEEISFDASKYSITSGSVVNGDELKIHLSSSLPSKMDAGQYPIEFSFNNPNYHVKTNSAYVIILPREITLSVGEYVFTYGEVDLSELGYSVTSGSVVEWDKITISFNSDINSNSEVGKYSIKGYSSNKNYTITVEDGSVEITPRAITISTKQTRVYGESGLNVDDYTLVSGSIVNNDDLDITFSTSAIATSNVGEYSIEILSCNKNYDISLLEGQLEITPRPLIIALKSQSSQYGDEVKLSNSAFTIKTPLPDFAQVSDLQILLSTSANSASEVGKYPITASCLNENYDFSYLDADMRITQRKLIITLEDQNVAYSQNIKIDSMAYTITDGQVLDGDELDVEVYCTSSNISSFGGNYVLTAKCENENYNIIIISSTLHVQASLQSVILIISIPLGALFVSVSLILIFGKKKRKKKKFNF